MATLELRDARGRTLGKWNLGCAAPCNGTVSVEENLNYMWCLSDAEVHSQYDIEVGDRQRAPDGDARWDGGGVGHSRYADGKVMWPLYEYFESGRGRTTVRVIQRRGGETGEARVDALTFYVVPSKIGEERYEAMVSCLHTLSAALVFELLGKSKRSYEHRIVNRGVSRLTKELELRRIRVVLDRLVPLVRRMAVTPVCLLVRARCSCLYWGDKPLSTSSLVRLAGRGAGPCQRYQPVRIPSTRLSETADTAEHRYLLAFLRLLRHRLADCVEAIDRQTRDIEQDRANRDSGARGRSRVYEQYDRPKLARLSEARSEAGAISDRIRTMERLALFKGVEPRLQLLSPHHFGHNPVYRTALTVMQEFLRAGTIWLGDARGVTEGTIKATSRLYEHWVFLRLVDAFRAVGVDLEPWGDFLRKFVESRYTLEFQKGLRFEGAIAAGRTIRVSFEPWVKGKAAAATEGLTVCRESEGGMSWSPDILIELITNGCTRYAIICDCKYKRAIRWEREQNTMKYREIRSVGSARQVVGQVWLVYPGGGGSITPRDSAVLFGDQGLNCPAGETVDGTICAMPEVGEVRDGRDSLRRFAFGTVEYLRGMSL